MTESGKIGLNIIISLMVIIFAFKFIEDKTKMLAFLLSLKLLHYRLSND